MSLIYYGHKLEEYLQNLEHIRRYCEHEDAEIPSLRHSIEYLKDAIRELKESPALTEEKRKNFEL